MSIGLDFIKRYGLPKYKIDHKLLFQDDELYVVQERLPPGNELLGERVGRETFSRSTKLYPRQGMWAEETKCRIVNNHPAFRPKSSKEVQRITQRVYKSTLAHEQRSKGEFDPDVSCYPYQKRMSHSAVYWKKRCQSVTPPDGSAVPRSQTSCSLVSKNRQDHQNDCKPRPKSCPAPTTKSTTAKLKKDKGKITENNKHVENSSKKSLFDLLTEDFQDDVSISESETNSDIEKVKRSIGFNDTKSTGRESCGYSNSGDDRHAAQSEDDSYSTDFEDSFSEADENVSAREEKQDINTSQSETTSFYASSTGTLDSGENSGTDDDEETLGSSSRSGSSHSSSKLSSESSHRSSRYSSRISRSKSRITQRSTSCERSTSYSSDRSSSCSTSGHRSSREKLSTKSSRSRSNSHSSNGSVSRQSSLIDSKDQSDILDSDESDEKNTLTSADNSYHSFKAGNSERASSSVTDIGSQKSAKNINRGLASGKTSYIQDYLPKTSISTVSMKSGAGSRTSLGSDVSRSQEGVNGNGNGRETTSMRSTASSTPSGGRVKGSNSRFNSTISIKSQRSQKSELSQRSTGIKSSMNSKSSLKSDRRNSVYSGSSRAFSAKKNNGSVVSGRTSSYQSIHPDEVSRASTVSLKSDVSRSSVSSKNRSDTSSIKSKSSYKSYKSHTSVSEIYKNSGGR